MYIMAILSEIKSHSDVIDYFKKLPFYNKPIKKPIKPLKGCAMSYKVEIVQRKDRILQLEASKLSIKNLFSDLLNETKRFKCPITVEVLLKKYKFNGEIEFRPVYFNSVTKTVINYRFRLENSFEEILYMIDVWINNGSG